MLESTFFKGNDMGLVLLINADFVALNHLRLGIIVRVK